MSEKKKWKMTKEVNRLVYGLTDVQRRWSTARLRRIMRDKRYHVKARNHFYAELLARRGAR